MGVLVPLPICVDFLTYWDKIYSTGTGGLNIQDLGPMIQDVEKTAEKMLCLGCITPGTKYRVYAGS
jgi:hypothetical protein